LARRLAASHEVTVLPSGRGMRLWESCSTTASSTGWRNAEGARSASQKTAADSLRGFHKPASTSRHQATTTPHTRARGRSLYGKATPICGARHAASWRDSIAEPHRPCAPSRRCSSPEPPTDLEVLRARPGRHGYPSCHGERGGKASYRRALYPGPRRREAEPRGSIWAPPSTGHRLRPAMCMRRLGTLPVGNRTADSLLSSSTSSYHQSRGYVNRTRAFWVL